MYGPDLPRTRAVETEGSDVRVYIQFNITGRDLVGAAQYKLRPTGQHKYCPKRRRKHYES